jgi:hypothetical protein
MTSFRDPPRLRDGDESLAKAIDEMAAEEPTASQLRSVALKARLALGLPPTGAPPGAPPPATTSGGPPMGVPAASWKGTFAAVQWMSHVVIPMGIGALGAVALHVASAPSSVTVPPDPATATAPRIEPAPLTDDSRSPTVPRTQGPWLPNGATSVDTTGSAPVTPQRGGNKLTRPGSEPALAAPTEPIEGPSAPSMPVTEISIVTSAHHAVASDPARALDLTREHELRFPGGALAQEREVIAIQALLRLGRRSDAETRAAQFRAQFPCSAHARRIDVILSESTRGH